MTYLKAEPNMNSSLASSGLLEDFFKDFYYELLRCKELALRTGRKEVFPQDLEKISQEEEKEEKDQADAQDQESEASNDQDAEAESSDSAEKPEDSEGPEVVSANNNKNLLDAFSDHEETPIQTLKTIHDIQNQLKQVLAAQTEKVLHLLDQMDTLQFKEAHYAMVALADEVFLNLPWNGTLAWRKFLLEGQIFQTQSAGAQIFQRIDTLLSKYDPTRIGVAKIYFLILSLGFKGQYNNIEAAPIVKNYERRLYVFIYGKNPALDKYSSVKLIPDCYEHTIRSNVFVKLPGVRFWTRTILAVLGIYLFISCALWYRVASDLYKPLDHIFSRFQHYLSTH